MVSLHFPLYTVLLAYSMFISTTAINPELLAPNSPNCDCGYYDSTTNHIFTESIIVYFNETAVLPGDFQPEVYTNHYEQNWNALFRQGSNSSNVLIDESSGTLDLHVSPPTPDHIVVGGGIRSLRSDIQYGSFRTLMRSPRPYSGGSSLSMMLQFNDTESIQMNVMNTDSPSKAWVSMLMNNEWSSRNLGMNFSVIMNASQKAVVPWDYTEYRIDWSEEELSWTIGGNLSRSALRNTTSFPTAPCPIFFKHWSIGDPYAMEGPPMHDTVANLVWARLFFNSTTMNETGHRVFDAQCDASLACSTEDMSLRGSSSYSLESTLPWTHVHPSSPTQWVAIWMAVSCITISTLLLLHTFFLRAVSNSKPEQTLDQFEDQASVKASGQISNGSSITSTKIQLSQLSLNDAALLSSESITIANSSNPVSRSVTPIPNDSTRHIKLVNEKLSIWRSGGSAKQTKLVELVEQPAEPPLTFDSRASTVVKFPLHSILENHEADLIFGEPSKEKEDEKQLETKATKVQDIPATKEALQPKKRLDYLAGLTAICSIMVSVDHFCSTFVPAVIIPGAPKHYETEVWANKYVTPFLLNQIWVGAFFTTSARFTISRYVRNGDIRDIAEKVVTRNFRIMIPVTCVAILEYFFVQCGAIKWLQYLPSITWSPWPYVVGYTTFGSFISEILELVYFVPNGAPRIIFNYCTGVLWTIPVQLQGAWLILVGVVVIREIKTPWKKFIYYAICVLSNWYASSWGSYFWVGLILTDLDMTYKYKKWILPRPFIFWPLIITYFTLACACLSVDVANQVRNFSVVTREHGIHPDPATGLPIYQTGPATFPPYFIPRLNGLVFATCCQALIELSPSAQKFFGSKVLLLIFPHIFTIYLFHGLIIWSMGSLVCIFFSVHGLTYWLNVLLTGFCCYAALFLSLPLMTPVVELLGKNITLSIWNNAYIRPPPKKPTLFPFPSNLFENPVADDIPHGEASI